MPEPREPEKTLPVYFAGPKRPRGRPRVEEPRASVSTWLPASYHDRLIKMANNRNESVSSLVKSMLMLQLRRPPT